MESLSESPYLKYNSDTLDHLRKEYGFDQPVRMVETINILEEWLKKQEHFVVKIIPREYLERIIIFNKGSVEKSKSKLDKICTIRSLLPELFDGHNVDELSLCQDALMDVVLPKMTPDYCRIHIFKAGKGKIDAAKVTQYFKLFIIVSDYVQLYDYNNGLIYLADWRDGSIVDLAMSMNIADFRRTLDIAFEGHSMRIKAIHILTESKAVGTLVAIFKQVMSAKISARIRTHSSLDTIYEVIHKSVLPMEYGGDERPLHELQGNFLDDLKSDAFIKYRREINKIRTDEAFRPKDKFYEYMGMPGTFRNLSVD